MRTAAIILAAGAGTRMKSKRPKVVHEILQKPMIEWVIDAAKIAGIDDIVTVVGHCSDQVIPLIDDESQIVHQLIQAGTADAVRVAMDSDIFNDRSGSVVILSGDCPLIGSETISKMIALRDERDAGCVVLTMELEDPFGYGRVICDPIEDEYELRSVIRIVEQKDASEIEAAVKECNSGIYCFDTEALRDALSKVGNDNAQGEFYLTDVLEIISANGGTCLAYTSSDPSECLGVNSRVQLAEASAILQRHINEAHMENGVTMIAPDLVWIGPDVTIESDVTIYPNVQLYGATTIKEGTVIGSNTRLMNTIVGRDCNIEETIAIDATLDDHATAGPRAYLRPGAHLCEHAKAGTHVEIKKSTVGKNSKVPHLSYIGDTTIGEDVNIGAGSITCNYDGYNKHATKIGDGTFIGSDTMMVAPVEIGRDAVIGAGSVITKDVPDGALAVARAKERIIDGWAAKRKSNMSK